MRRLLFALALTAISAHSAHSAKLHACYNNERVKSHLHEHTDARIRAIYIDVLARARMHAELFSICEYEGPIPGIMPIATGNGRHIFELVMPTYLRSFSDKQLTGIIAHEVGHVSVGFQLIGSIANESAADARAAQWVGNSAVIAGLNSMRPELWRFGPKWAKPIEDQFDERIRALMALP